MVNLLFFDNPFDPTTNTNLDDKSTRPLFGCLGAVILLYLDPHEFNQLIEVSICLALTLIKHC